MKTSLYIDDDLWQRARERAFAERRPVTALVGQCIEAYLVGAPKEKRKPDSVAVSTPPPGLNARPVPQDQGAEFCDRCLCPPGKRLATCLIPGCYCRHGERK